jgi:hypothetical protein
MQGVITATIRKTGCTVPAGTLTINLWAGLPMPPQDGIVISPYLTFDPSLYVCPNDYVNFALISPSVGNIDGVTNYEWDSSCGNIVYYSTPDSTSIGANIANGQTLCGDVRVRAVNACGASDWLII